MYVPLDILKIVANYVTKPIMTLLDWIDKEKLYWYYLSANPNAIYLLEQNKNKINWVCLTTNPDARHLLEQNKDKIKWNNLSLNPNIFEIDKQQTKIYITQNAKKIEKIMNGKISSCCLL